MKKWLADLLDNHYLPAIAALKDNPADRAKVQEWTDWLKAKWVSRGLTELNQQRTLMTDTRNAIKAIDPNHIALESMNFTTAQWREMNNPSEDAVEQRNENQQLIEHPDAIVAKACELLDSNDWAEVAAGIVVCTGRRSSEVLATAQFEYKTAYSVIFTGQLKRHGENTLLQFEIPTLVPAQKVIDALAFLRREVRCTGLENRQVNLKYGGEVAQACDRHFTGLVPQREGKDNLYTHLFRAVYARIAVFYYCPVQVADIVYMAAIQGHYQVLEAGNAKLRRSYASTRNYFDYKIGDGKGNIDGRQGIKLGQPSVEVLEVFIQPITKIEVQQLESGVNVLAPALQAKTVATTNSQSGTSNSHKSVSQPAETVAEAEYVSAKTSSTSKRQQTRLRAWDSDRARLADLSKRWNTSNQQITISVALDLAESTFELASLLKVPPEPMQIIAKVNDLLAAVQQAASLPAPKPEPTTKQSEQTPPEQTETDRETIDAPVPYQQAQASELTPVHQLSDSTAVPAFNEAWQRIAELTEAVTRLTQQLSPIAEFAITQAQSEQPTQAIEPIQIQPQPARPQGGQPNTTSSVNTQTDKAVEFTFKPQSQRKKGSAQEHIHHCVQAIMQFNDSQQRTHEERWAINQTSVQRLSGSNRDAVKRYLADHAEKIAQHNALYNLTERHNTGKGRRGFLIEDIVQLPQPPAPLQDTAVASAISAADPQPASTNSKPPEQPVVSPNLTPDVNPPKPQIEIVPGPAYQRIEQAVQAIMDYNNYTATEKDQKWALTASAVARLCGCNRSAINRYFEEHRLAIADHNAKHQLTASHNISKGRKGKLPHG